MPAELLRIQEITSSLFVLSISSLYFPPNFASAFASVIVVSVSFAYINTSALASASCATCPAADASSATPYTKVMSHSGCSSANFSHMVCSHSPLSFDWSSDGDQTIRRMFSFPPPEPLPLPHPANIDTASAAVSRTANPLFFIITALSFQKSFVLFR